MVRAPQLTPGGAAALFAGADDDSATFPLHLQLLSAQEIGLIAGVAETWQVVLSDGAASVKATLARVLAPAVRPGGAVRPLSMVAVTGAVRRDEDGKRCVAALRWGTA